MRGLLLAALLLAPLAAADHVYSHRFVVEGRVLGGNDLPVPGVRVHLDSTDELLFEPCPGGHRDVTDEWGDFTFCYHRHEMPQGLVTVVAGQEVQRRAIDRDLRRLVFFLRDESATGVAPEGWNRTFHIDGRVWERGATVLDGVNVTGVALRDVPVRISTVNATRAEGDLSKGSNFTLETDGYGDYRGIIRLFPTEAPRDVVLTIETMGVRAERRLNVEFHRMTEDFRLPLEVEEVPRPPGTRSGPLSVPLILAVVAGLVVAIVAARRK